MHLIKSLALLIPFSLLRAEGISRIAVTDDSITVHPSPGQSGLLKVVAIEPYDSYQSAGNWQLGGSNDGGVVDFNREGSALATFSPPAVAFDPQLSNPTDLIEADIVSHLAIRMKVNGFSGTLPARAFVFGEGISSAAFDIVADGTWQIARIDLTTITGTTTWSGQRTLRLDLIDGLPINGFENVEIEIDWIAVTNKPDFENPLTWGRWDKFWDLGYQAAAVTAEASAPITLDRFDGPIDRYYQKFLLVDGFTPVGNPHWVDDFSGLSYKTTTDHGFAPNGPGAGSGVIENGVYQMTYVEGSPFDPQLVTMAQEVNATRIRYLHARVRMTGYMGSAPSITASMFSTAGGVSQVSVPFVPDGTWQTLHFDMQAAQNWNGYENIRLDIPNNAGIAASDFLNATLEVDWIAATNQPDYDGSGRLGGYELKHDFEIDRLQTTIVPFKGRQGVDSFAPDDFAILGADTGKLNLTLNQLVQNTATPRVRWKQDGITFGINPDFLNQRLDQIAIMGDLGIHTYCTMLNQSNPTLASDPNWPFINIRSSPASPNNLYAFNTGDAYGLRYTRAVMEYTVHRMAQPGVTPAIHWIHGNEIDAHWFWHNLGLISASAFRDYFAVEFRQAALVLAKYHPEFRVLLSHTHHWLSQGGNASQSMPSKTLIDELNTKWKSEGNFAWDVAAHPYPQNLFQPAFWNDTQATLDFETTKITYKNLEVLPVYFQRPELLFNGKQRAVSLTEQGFHTAANESGQAVQAAAYAYHWHRFKRIPGIQADILHRFADNANEGGLLLGLVTLGGERKEIFDVFAAADTPAWRTTFDTYLPHLPFNSWDDLSSVPAWTVLDHPFDEAGYTGAWQSLKNIDGFSANAAGNLVGTAVGSDPQIGNNHLFALERDAERFLIRMKTDSGATAEIFWGTQTANLYQSTRKFTWDTIADDEFHIYDIDTVDHPEWDGQLIRRFRIDPTNVSSGSFEIDYILTGKRGDFDGDGVSDEDEGIATLRDTDGDGIPDFADPAIAGAVGAYESWLMAHPSHTGTSRHPDGDPDGDGLVNGVEFLMGTNPANAGDFARPESGLTPSGDFFITFPRDPSARFHAVFVEHGPEPSSSENRIPIPRGATTGPPVTVITQAGAADEITVIIPHSPGGRSFARIGIEIPFQP
jgi:hypothetical protein